MGTISTGVGLVSGFPTAEIIDQLMTIERRPLDLVNERIEEVQAVRTAFLDLSARLLSVKTSVGRFKKAESLRTYTAASSNESVLKATASSDARVGSYHLTVQSLVAHQQLVATGMPDADTTPVGTGTLTIEGVAAQLDRGTRLEVLNGQTGVRTGRMTVTDRSGASATIDLAAAQTVRDVLDAINGSAEISVRAEVRGDAIAMVDQSGGSGSLVVADQTGHTAADLGIAGAVAGPKIAGGSVVSVNAQTQLAILNDGLGVRRDGALDDLAITRRDGTVVGISLAEVLKTDTALVALNGGSGVRAGTLRITDRSGANADVDLSGAERVQDVIDAIEGAGVGVSVTIINRHLLVSDHSGGSGTLSVEDVDGSAAADLGLAGRSETGSIVGGDIYRVATLGDVARAINTDGDNADGALVASISDDGLGLTLTDGSTGAGTLKVEALNGSHAADDLGLVGEADSQIVGRRLLAGLNTVLLRTLHGGSGAAAGVIEVLDRGGLGGQIDLSGAATLADVLDAINASGARVTARVNDVGNGIVLSDHSGQSGSLIVGDLSGTLAADLGIEHAARADAVASGNLHRQYVGQTTRLAELNAGRGVAAGKFKVTDSLGASATVDLSGDEKTLGDVIREINSRGIGVVASINATGDGLLLSDTAGGTGRLKVEAVAGTTAADLHILGEATEGATALDGTYEFHVDVTAGDTLDDVVAKLADAGAPVTAAVINDGSRYNPYRLTLRSVHGGREGAILFDPGGTSLATDTLAEARDAVVFVGSADATNPVVVTSGSNTLDDLIDGVTLELHSASPTPVEINVSEDVDNTVSAVKSFVTAVNAVVDRIDALTKFDPETNERGVLLGDRTVDRVRNRMLGLVASRTMGTGGDLQYTWQVGLRLRDQRVQFDEATFREAYAADPDAVMEFFTDAEAGFGAVVEDVLEQLTDSQDGTLAKRDDVLDSNEELLNKRAEQLEALLADKRARLQAQFLAMEMSLAKLQSQQTALQGFTVIPPSTGGIANLMG